MLNGDLTGRLTNWKFESALRYLDDDVTKDEREVVTSLACVFGNIGYVDGEMGTIISAAVASLGIGE